MTEEELAEDGNDHLAIYSKIGADAISFLLYFNMNTQINWDPVEIGRAHV